MVWGCSRSDSEQKRAIELLNERRFSEVISLLEDTDSPDKQRLLAQAHLGASGFELLPFIRSVLNEQDLRGWDELLTFARSGCEAQKVELKSAPKVPPICGLIRALNQVPFQSIFERSEAVTHIQSAHRIYSYLALTSSKPSDHFEYSISAMLLLAAHIRSLVDETNVVVLKRYADLTLSDAMRVDHHLIHHSKGALLRFLDIAQGLRLSYRDFAKLIRSQDGKVLLSVNGVPLVFSDQLTEEKLLLWVREVILSPVDRAETRFYEAYSTHRDSFKDSLLKLPVHAFQDSILRTQEGALLTLFNGISGQFRRLVLALTARSDEAVRWGSDSVFGFGNDRLTRFVVSLNQVWALESSQPLRDWIGANADWIQVLGELIIQIEEILELNQDPEIRRFIESVTLRYCDKSPDCASIIQGFNDGSLNFDSRVLKWVGGWVSLANDMAKTSSPRVLDWQSKIESWLGDAELWLKGDVPPSRIPQSTTPGRASPKNKKTKRVR